MDNKILKNALFNVEIKGKLINIKKGNINYNEALEIANDCLKASETTDLTLHNNLLNCIKHFGFAGYGGRTDGITYNISISAFMKKESTNEEVECDGHGAFFGKVKKGVWNKVGEDRVCSICGSMHPDEVIELIRTGKAKYEGSTKSYKMYISRKEVPNASFGGIKYYRNHDNENFVERFNEALKENKNN